MELIIKCCECGAETDNIRDDWVSVDYGVFICPDCADEDNDPNVMTFFKEVNQEKDDA